MQECQPPNSSTKSDFPIPFKMDEVKSFDVNIQEARNFSSGSQTLDSSISAKVSETSASRVIDLQKTNSEAIEEISEILVSNATEPREPAVSVVEPEVNNSDIHLSSSISTYVCAKTSPMYGKHGCQCTLSNCCITGTEALQDYVNSGTGSSYEGISLSSENNLNQVTSLADEVNLIPCFSERTIKMCDDPVSPSFVKNVTGFLVFEQKINRSLSCTHVLLNSGGFITEITPDSTHEGSKTKNNICDHPLDDSSSTDHHIVDTIISANHISDTVSELCRVDVSFSGNSDISIFSSAISSINVPFL